MIKLKEDKELDTTINIWEWYFKVRVPYLETRGNDVLRATGVVISGVPEIDKDIPNRWMTTMMTIASMVELYQEGIYVRVVTESDTKLIYDYISAHIYAWKKQLENGINIGDAPIDDLILMDEFANVVYPHAKHHFEKGEIDSIITRHFGKLSSFRVNNFFDLNALNNLSNSTNGEYGLVKINEDTEESDRESLGEFFKNRLITLSRR